VVIEDSDLGVNAAKKEGFFCIRFDPNNSFNEGREDLKVSSYNELRLEINSIDSN
jgi:beta-phosphoglucomutase-like phosphatase (HAD superfamily)